jgi:hypothetical protein
MIKMSLIAITLFYFMGVFGVSVAQLWVDWNVDESLSVQAIDALTVALVWPLLIIDNILPT